MLPKTPIIFLMSTILCSMVVNIPPLKAGPEDADPVHRPVVQEKIGYYAIYLPPDYHDAPEKTYPLCVFLHGSGSTETSHANLYLRTLDREGVIYIAPRAANLHHGLFRQSKKLGWTVWSEYPESWGKHDDPQFPKSWVEGKDPMDFHTDFIANCIDDVRQHYRVDQRKAILVGHSQGGSSAIRFSERHPEKLRAFFSYAGYGDDRLLKNDAWAQSLKSFGIKAVITHCEGDQKVEVQQATQMEAYFKEHGVAASVIIEKGGNHSFSPRMKHELKAFVSKWCHGKEIGDYVPIKLIGEILVTKVNKASNAALAGMKKDDVILSYNGIKVRNLAELATAKKAVPERTEQVDVVIRRGKETLTLKLNPGTLGIGAKDQ